MLENNGVLSHGVLTEILNIATHQLLASNGRTLIIEQMMIYFLQAVQLDDYLTLKSRLVRETRRSAIIDYDIYLVHQLVAKATITVKIN